MGMKRTGWFSVIHMHSRTNRYVHLYFFLSCEVWENCSREGEDSGKAGKKCILKTLTFADILLLVRSFAPGGLHKVSFFARFCFLSRTRKRLGQLVRHCWSREVSSVLREINWVDGFSGSQVRKALDIQSYVTRGNPRTAEYAVFDCLSLCFHLPIELDRTVSGTRKLGAKVFDERGMRSQQKAGSTGTCKDKHAYHGHQFRNVICIIALYGGRLCK